MAQDDGDVNELISDLAGADSLDAELHREFATPHGELYGGYEEEDDQEDEEAEDRWAAQEAAAAASGFAAMWRQQHPQRGRGRGRGRGRVGRPSKSAVVAALAAEAAEAAEAAGGEGGRRRRHQPSSRFEGHVLFEEGEAGAAEVSWCFVFRIRD
jgi:hypothetical protein